MVLKVRKALLDALAYATQSYPLDMRTSSDYGPYKVLYISSSAYTYKENKKNLRSTQINLKDWEGSLPETKPKPVDALKSRKVVEEEETKLSGRSKAKDVGAEFSGERYKLKDLLLTNGTEEFIPVSHYGDVEEAFVKNFLSLVDKGGMLRTGRGDRRTYAVVMGTYYAKLKAELAIRSSASAELGAPVAAVETVNVQAGLAANQNLKQLGEGAIGIRMHCFPTRKLTDTASMQQWEIGEGISIGHGRKPTELKDVIVWTSRSLMRRFVIWWNPERFAFGILDVKEVHGYKNLDAVNRKLLTQYTKEDDTVAATDESSTTMEIDPEVDKSNSMEIEPEEQVPPTTPPSTPPPTPPPPTLTADAEMEPERIRGGGNGDKVDEDGGEQSNGIDDDGFVMGFNLRKLQSTFMGVTILPVSLEAFDHDDFDDVIKWKTITSSIKDGVSSINISSSPSKPSEKMVKAKKDLVVSCIEALQNRALLKEPPKVRLYAEPDGVKVSVLPPTTTSDSWRDIPQNKLSKRETAMLQKILVSSFSGMQLNPTPVAVKAARATKETSAQLPVNRKRGSIKLNVRLTKGQKRTIESLLNAEGIAKSTSKKATKSTNVFSRIDSVEAHFPPDWAVSAGRSKSGGTQIVT